MASPDPSRPPVRLPRRRAEYGFQPRIAVGVLYFLAFFFLYGLLIVLPQLLEVLEQVPPGPEQQEIAKQVAHEAIGTRVYAALALALATVGLGGYYQVLPGMRIGRS